MSGKKIAIIGLGDFGKALVKKLNQEGNEVTAIDKDIKTIEEIKDYCTHAVCLDSTDESALLAQGIQDMDLIYLSSSASFEALILTTKILEKHCPKERIIVRYRNEIQKEILEKMFTIQKIFNPEEEAANNMAIFAKHIHKIVGKTFFVFGDYELIELEVPKKYYNKTIQETKIRDEYHLNILLLKREETELEARGDTVLLEKDKIYVFGSQSNIQRFIKNIDLK
ncbi:MAG: potassium channel family protein [Leptonema sp. (in: bacteria)]